MVLKRWEYTDQQVALSPTMGNLGGDGEEVRIGCDGDEGGAGR
jgi:hypothetical protein